MKNKSDKGVKGGSCNVTNCQKPGANYYNKSTQKYYCAECAEEINWPGGRADCMELYGVPLLCEIDAALPVSIPATCCGDRLKPCKCGADVWKYVGDNDCGDWDEAVYDCTHCGNRIRIELPD